MNNKFVFLLLLIQISFSGDFASAERFPRAFEMPNPIPWRESVSQAQFEFLLMQKLSEIEELKPIWNDPSPMANEVLLIGGRLRTLLVWLDSMLSTMTYSEVLKTPPPLLEHLGSLGHINSDADLAIVRVNESPPKLETYESVVALERYLELINDRLGFEPRTQENYRYYKNPKITYDYIHPGAFYVLKYSPGSAFLALAASPTQIHDPNGALKSFVSGRMRYVPFDASVITAEIANLRVSFRTPSELTNFLHAAIFVRHALELGLPISPNDWSYLHSVGSKVDLSQKNQRLQHATGQLFKLLNEDLVDLEVVLKRLGVFEQMREFNYRSIYGEKFIRNPTKEAENASLNTFPISVNFKQRSCESFFNSFNNKYGLRRIGIQ